MSRSATLLLALLVSAATAAATTLALGTGAETAPSGDDRHLAGLAAAVARMQEEQQLLRAEVAALAAKAGSAQRSGELVVSDEQVAAAVARHLAARGTASPAAAGGEAAFDLDRALAAVLGTHGWQNPEGWKAIHAAGRMDEVIARLEAAAKAAPNDAQAHMDLANAYLAYLNQDPSKWPLSMKADREFDRVLELDPAHWHARFTKAVSYTFWPDFLGKKQEAIAQFEVLLQQQEALPPAPEHAETYLYLGNLLEQRGERERARAVWNQGARRHPDSRELQNKLRS